MNEGIYEVRDNVDHKILKTYKYGSRVYGCHTKDSDYDYILVVEAEKDLCYNVNLKNVNLKVYSESLFIKKIKEHDIGVLECIFQYKSDPYVKHFKLHKPTLRRSISAVAGNSFVKCKKKLMQGDYYIGKKSLFHSLRILGFGNQIALTGKIVNYSKYNKYLDEIMSIESNEWEDFKSIFKSEYNRMKSNFKINAPLEEE